MRPLFLIRIILIAALGLATLMVPWMVVIISMSTGYMKQPDLTPSVTSTSEANRFIANIPPDSAEEDNYLIGVLAAEVPASFQMEALKAQAIAARSYFHYRTAIEGHTMTDSERTGQKYISIDEMKQKWGIEFKINYERLSQAVKDTKSKRLVYESQPVLATFFSSSNGSTESSENVWGKSFDYLVPVKSPYEAQLDRQRADQYKFSWEQLGRTFDVPARTIRQSLKIEQQTQGNRAATIRLSAKRTIPATEFRSRLGLSSTAITFQKERNQCVIETSGYGHGVGMSQWGAEALARKGWTAEQILEHYYPGTQIHTVLPI